MKLIQSQKNYGKLISFKRFLYRKDKTNSSTINWRCTVKSCKGRLITSLQPSDGDTPSERGEHHHLPDPARLEVKQLHERTITQKKQVQTGQ